MILALVLVLVSVLLLLVGVGNNKSGHTACHFAITPRFCPRG